MHINDDGLKFIATLKGSDGGFITRETVNRKDLLEWVRVHVADLEHLTLTIEATGVAALPMLMALTFGQIQLESRLAKEPDAKREEST